MRIRLSLLLTVMLAVTLVSLGVPLARSLAADQARRVHLDRSADAARFASLVPDGPDPAAELALERDLGRYHELYGIAIGVFDTAGRVELAAGSIGPATGGGAVGPALRAALAGRSSDAPEALWPWDDAPLVVAEPVVRSGDVVGAVLSVSPTDRARGVVLRGWLLLAVGELVALLLGGLIAVRLARWVLRPVGVLSQAAQRIANGDLAARVRPSGGPPELRRLGGSFNDMADTVQASLQAQRAFVADAEHQLRNPLNALLVRLDGMQPGDSPQARTAVAAAAEDGRYLAATLDRMLELARAEHAGASAEQLDLGALVDQRLAYWRVVAEHRSIRLRRTGVLHATCWHEPAAISGAVDAVLDNALKYSPGHSTVGVDVHHDDGAVAVSITDQGPGLPAADLERAAVRFWRGNGTGPVDGSGLGLSIASALLERRGGRLHIGAAEGGGLQVDLGLQRSEDHPVQGFPRR